MKKVTNKFKKFYGEHVVLSQKEKTKLIKKKDLNISRLKDGLKEYNEENGTDYKLAEEAVVQGSVAMSTVTQNEDNDYDIDVAIVFEKDNLPPGTQKTKNVIVDALTRKCTGFNEPPTAKTNCVTIKYKDGYHIDFAIYRRYKETFSNDYTYEHCGSEWRKRDPRSLTKWFNETNKETGNKLREVVRLLKMFSKSRDSWVNMPGGLILSVLASEFNDYGSYTSMDEYFYEAIKSIRDRLAFNKEVYNPTDSTTSLKLAEKDSTRMENLYNRLNDKMKKLDVLFENNCSKKQAVDAWKEFFDHPYWVGESGKESVAKLFARTEEPEYNLVDETEEFISHMLPISLRDDYVVDLDCRVTNNNEVFVGWLKNMTGIYPTFSLHFKATTNVPGSYEVYWKVKNNGEQAIRENDVRGEIRKTNSLNHFEEAKFKGDHYVEVYIVQRNMVVARKRITVPIIV
ncbi:nucleotide-binding domain-containing protein [Rossellomorea marisflavi]|uniref:nucleotide-binding domain-containing protein n=1 Tax=Rossellomorea marisflavi TaxID=189381 RepID=UPI003F9F0ABC